MNKKTFNLLLALSVALIVACAAMAAPLNSANTMNNVALVQVNVNCNTQPVAVAIATATNSVNNPASVDVTNHASMTAAPASTGAQNATARVPEVTARSGVITSAFNAEQTAANIAG